MFVQSLVPGGGDVDSIPADMKNTHTHKNTDGKSPLYLIHHRFTKGKESNL